MKKYLSGFLILLASCQPVAEQRSTRAHFADTSATSKVNSEDPTYSDTTEYATYYLAIADTGKDYYALDRRMYELSKGLNLEVDTMNRYYNKDKNRIVLADTDEDEMYRGEYFPRRYPSNSLSLEYLDVFDENAKENTIALVAGMYETQPQADSAIRLLRQAAPKTYMLKSNVYIGCMH